MAKDRFTTVRIPRELHEQIKELIENRKELGYHTVSRFIDDAVKAKLDRVDDIPKPPGDSEGQE